MSSRIRMINRMVDMLSPPLEMCFAPAGQRRQIPAISALGPVVPADAQLPVRLNGDLLDLGQVSDPTPP
jgi:hypothetical protein